MGMNEWKGQDYGKVAIKHDTNKPRLDLVDSDALNGLAAVLTFGANKYSAHNWRGGFAWSRLIAALLRHTFAIIKGEDTDPESGLPHIDHVGCCWMFLSWHMKNRKDLDDRYNDTGTHSPACFDGSLQQDAGKATSGELDHTEWFRGNSGLVPSVTGVVHEHDIRRKERSAKERLIAGLKGQGFNVPQGGTNE